MNAQKRCNILNFVVYPWVKEPSKVKIIKRYSEKDKNKAVILIDLFGLERTFNCILNFKKCKNYIEKILVISWYVAIRFKRNRYVIEEKLIKYEKFILNEFKDDDEVLKEIENSIKNIKYYYNFDFQRAQRKVFQLLFYDFYNNDKEFNFQNLMNLLRKLTILFINNHKNQIDKNIIKKAREILNFNPQSTDEICEKLKEFVKLYYNSKTNKRILKILRYAIASYCVLRSKLLINEEKSVVLVQN